MIQIRIKKGEDVGRAMKRLKKAVDREGLIKHIRATRYFEKPSEKKRKKSARARARARSLARRALMTPQEREAARSGFRSERPDRPERRDAM